MKEKKKMSLLAKQSAAGWVFLTPATILIAIMAFWPMVQAFIMSLQTGSSANLQWNDPIFNNYTRMFSDKVFMTSVGNTFLYLIIQVPIMLVLAILLAQLLNNHHLRFKGFFRTCVFLPCATALDLQIPVCDRRTDQCHSGKFRNSGTELQFPWSSDQREGRDHPGADLEMDRLQHGILSGRSLPEPR